MKKISRRNFLRIAGLAAATGMMTACGGSNSTSAISAGSTASGAAASNWPDGDVTIYVTAGAGGSSDTIVRQFVERMKKITGQNIIVVNDTTGGNSVAYETVRNAKPDGLTLLGYHGGLCVQYASGQYSHSLDEFTVVGSLTSSDRIGYGIFVNGKSEFNTWDDFVQYAKAHPNELTVGVETNNADHLLEILLEQRFGYQLSIVSAGSNAEKIPLLMGGNLDVCLLSPSGVTDYVASGDLKCLCLFGEETLDDLMPGVPCFKDMGEDPELLSMFFYLAGPAGIPDEIAESINSVLEEISHDDTIYDVMSNYAMNWTWEPLEDVRAHAHEMQQQYVDAYALLK